MNIGYQRLYLTFTLTRFFTNGFPPILIEVCPRKKNYVIIYLSIRCICMSVTSAVLKKTNTVLEVRQYPTQIDL